MSISIRDKFYQHIIAFLTAMAVIGLTGCGKSADGHLSEDDMARLMADLYLGEALIDYNYAQFPNDSTRKILRQSIYAKNGVTQEMVDSSMAWYGRNIEQFIIVQEKAEEILREQQSAVSHNSKFLISEDGDSVTIWEGPARLLIGERMITNILKFSVAADSTWRDGDFFTLTFKPINALPDIKARLLIDYADGSTSYADFTPSYLNKYQVSLKSDSTLMPNRVYGYIKFPAEATDIYEVDSIYLTQQRKDRIAHYYTVDQIFNPNPIKEESEIDPEDDSTEETTEEEMQPNHASYNHQRAQFRHETSTKNLPKPSNHRSTSQKMKSGASHGNSSSQKPTDTEHLKRSQPNSAMQPVK